ncbi:MAG: chitobiase/beta-hexosaminidase C-terminal domain-containing protein, partial [Odoribacter sp.]|nr:chitobiase/beta-hexosaminidase C-terminal domain-containing protein [Odoribacter sp.]
DIHYTLDGTEPTAQSPKYTEPLKIKTDCTLKALAVRPSGNSRMFTEKINLNKATLKGITLLQPSYKQYTFKGAPMLGEGLQGNANYKTGRWIAFYGNDMEAVVDMQQPTEISKAAIAACVEKGDWIFDARGFAVEVSEDGEHYTRVAAEEYPAMKKEDPNGVITHQLTFDPVKARYVKLIAKSERQIPAWHGGKGKLGFLFVDEIVLN